MQTKKISLANLKGRLSRNEMKEIMGGTGRTPTPSDGCKGLKECTMESDCTIEPGCTKCSRGVCAD